MKGMITEPQKGIVASATSGTQFRLFQAAVIVKGINGFLQVIGGILLMVVGPVRINHGLDMLTVGQLEDSPNGLLLKLLTSNGVVRHVGPVDFAVFYLIANGLAKIAIVAALMKRKRRVFPYAVGFLGLFVAFGLVRLFTHRSPILAVAMAIDTIVIILIWREYKALAAEDAAHAAGASSIEAAPTEAAVTPA
jgi:uncharacterized membrane protein